MKKTQLILILCVIHFGQLLAQTCNVGIQYFSNQASVDNFNINHLGCKDVIGSIQISTNVSNVDSLYNIRSVSGYLYIDLSSNINLDGLNSNLKKIGGNFTLNGDFNIFNYFNALDTIGGNLTFSNGTVNKLEGFSNLKKVNYLGISNISILDSMLAFNAIDTISGLNITNSTINKLNAFSSVKKVVDGIYIYETSIQFPSNAFNALTNIGGDLSLSNTNLNKFISFNSLNKVGGDVVINNVNNVDTLKGFNNIVEIGNTLQIYDCNFKKINAFENLNIVKQNFEIQYLDLLDTLKGFNALDTISNQLNVNYNTSLKSIVGFSNLKKMNNLEIKYNNSINNIVGLDHIMNINTIDIFGNGSLSNCSIIPVCEKAWGNTGLTINYNSTGCESIIEVKNQCPSTPDQDGDGRPDAFDNCVSVFNPNQADMDGDNIGNACDGDFDFDADGLLNANDNCPFVINPGQEDANGNNVGDVCEPMINCNIGNKIYTKQSEVDLFPLYYPGCKIVEGNLSLSLGNAYSNVEIYDVNGFKQIERIKGNFNSTSNSTLQVNISGLKNLQRIDGSFTFAGLIYLANNDSAFAKLHTIGRDFNNNCNYNIPLFKSLDSIGGNFNKYNSSPSMTSLDYVGGNIFYASGQNLSILKNLDTIYGDLVISNINDLQSDNLESLKKINGSLTIGNSPVTINTFNGLTSIGKNLYISENQALKNILGFQNITSIGNNLFLTNNRYLDNIVGFDHAISTDSIIIKNNNFLNECDILPICQKVVTGGLSVVSNGLSCSGIQIVKQNCPSPTDTDSDSVPDLIDNCVAIPNQNQIDCNANGIGDACDFIDTDCDGIADNVDNCPSYPNKWQTDSNNNSIGDACEMNGKTGINTADPKSELHLKNSSIYIDNPEKSIIMKAHDGFCYTLNIVNGELKAVKVPCPSN